MKTILEILLTHLKTVLWDRFNELETPDMKRDITQYPAEYLFTYNSLVKALEMTNLFDHFKLLLAMPEDF